MAEKCKTFTKAFPVFYDIFPLPKFDTYFQVQKHKDDLLSYIIFLRITPFLPNWFINISSPVIDVPLLPFFVGTFVGKHVSVFLWILHVQST